MTLLNFKRSLTGQKQVAQKKLFFGVDSFKFLINLESLTKIKRILTFGHSWTSLNFKEVSQGQNSGPKKHFFFGYSFKFLIEIWKESTTNAPKRILTFGHS